MPYTGRVRWIMGLLAAGGLASSCAAQPGAQELDARLTRLSGTVYIHLHDHPEGDYIPAESDEQFAAGDEVKTGEESSAEITFNGDSVIELGANSDFRIASLEPARAEFHLDLGTLVAKVRSLLSRETMEFHTADAVASIRGTEFAVSREENQPTQVGVFDEGHVGVRGAGQASEVRLGPRQETEIHPGMPPARARTLSALAHHQTRLIGIRQRVNFFRTNWRPRKAAERRSIRARMGNRERIRGTGLPGLRPRKGARPTRSGGQGKPSRWSYQGIKEKVKNHMGKPQENRPPERRPQGKKPLWKKLLKKER